jgi:flagellin
MPSVNTNAGALVALQNLNATNKQLNEVQNRINTGLKVNGPQDDAAVYAIAQNLRSNLAGLGAVKSSLDRAVSTVDVAIAGGQAVSDLLTQMKAKAVAAADPGQDAASRTALQNDFNALRDQIKTITDNAEFNGVNLLKAGGTDVTAIVNDTGTKTITIAAQNLSLSTGSVLSITAGTTFTTATEAAAVVSAITSSLTAVNASLAKLGTGAQSVSAQRTFADKLSDAIEVGIGNLVDADLAKESARLQSLQVKQQLGIQALSIANQAPNVLLALFR